jgi:gamma-glutamyltranspeptidase/glutathione hydrolase
MLTPEYAASRAQLFDPGAASADATAGVPRGSSDTVSFSVVDAAGNAVSFINSNFMGFGSGLVPVGCGFSLQNRGAGFSLVDGHPNALGPRKRPYHTIIPLMLTARDGRLLATASNMGGFMQPQGHVQLVLNLLAFGADPQTAVDAPRLCIGDGQSNGAIALEDGIPEATVAALRAAGHRIGEAHVSGYARALFGRAQVILRHPASGVLWAGSDGRGDGQVAVCSTGAP